MTLERVRAICLAFPHATEQIQWGNNLVFKIGGKMFAIANLEPAGHSNALAFKCSPEEFSELVEREDVVPAPYLARAWWVSLAKFDILSGIELSRRLRDSYDLVVAGLPRRVQVGIGNESGTGVRRKRLNIKKKTASRQKK